MITDIQGLSKLKAHLKYLEHGKEHPNQPERGVIAHKLVFSLSQNELDELGTNMRELVRETMADWSRWLGQPLD